MNTAAAVRTVLRAEGFSCPSCVAKIEKRVGRLDGVQHVHVAFTSARIDIDHDPAVVTPDDLIAAVAKAGYKSTVSAF